MGNCRTMPNPGCPTPGNADESATHMPDQASHRKALRGMQRADMKTRKGEDTVTKVAPETPPKNQASLVGHDTTACKTRQNAVGISLATRRCLCARPAIDRMGLPHGADCLQMGNLPESAVASAPWDVLFP